jgi:hypothetical protein
VNCRPYMQSGNGTSASSSRFLPTPSLKTVELSVYEGLRHSGRLLPIGFDEVEHFVLKYWDAGMNGWAVEDRQMPLVKSVLTLNGQEFLHGLGVLRVAAVQPPGGRHSSSLRHVKKMTWGHYAGLDFTRGGTWPPELIDLTVVRGSDFYSLFPPRSTTTLPATLEQFRLICPEFFSSELKRLFQAHLPNLREVHLTRLKRGQQESVHLPPSVRTLIVDHHDDLTKYDRWSDWTWHLPHTLQLLEFREPLDYENKGALLLHLILNASPGHPSLKVRINDIKEGWKTIALSETLH